MNVFATHKSQLIDILRNTDISVPFKRSERTNYHVELWSIIRLLATLAEMRELAYPIKLLKHERPDYILEQNSIISGFEITEAINPKLAQFQTINEQQNNLGFYDPSLFKWGKNDCSFEELKELSKREKLTGTPWMGNAVEREYAKIINEIILKKTENLNKAGYSKYLKNNLIIYMNQTLPDLDSNEGSELCAGTLNSYWGSNSFDVIYVECYSQIHIYKESGFEITSLNDLWS